MYAEGMGHSRVSFLLVLCSLSAGCGPGGEEALPRRLGNHPLARRLEGEAARIAVDRMHGKGVAPLQSLIGFYGDAGGSGAVLYVSLYDNPGDASDAVTKMAEGIKRGGGVFSECTDFVVAGRPLSGCEGMGLRHYFFAAGSGVYWIAAPKERAFSLAQDLLARLADQEKVTRR